MKYTFVAKDGQIGSTLDFDQLPPVLDPSKGTWVVDIEPDHDHTLYACERVEPVSPDSTAIQYQLVPVSIDFAVDVAIGRVNDQRTRDINAGFMFRGKLIDSDSRSVQNIHTAAVAAQAAGVLGVPFAVTWTCADNTTLDLDAGGVLEMVVALGRHVADTHIGARVRKDDIRAAGEAGETVDNIVTLATI